MGVTKEATLQQSDGHDQLDNNIGCIVSGDIVTIMYKGWYIDKKSNKRKEFDDMFHSETKLRFTVDEETTTTNLFRGLHDAVKLLILGEKAKLRITSDCGFGNEEYKGYSGIVPPNSDLVLDLVVLSVTRNNAVHNRKQPKDSWGWKCLFHYCQVGLGGW